MLGGWLGLLLLVEGWTTVRGAGLCGVAGGVTKIVGGQSVDSLKYPWYVALVSPTSSSPLQVSCGGSLITSRHVLSAAHCFPRTKGVRPERLYRAVVGLVDRCSPAAAEQLSLARVRVHPQYNEQTLQADVSVVTLQRAVALTPVCLPPRNHQPAGPAEIIGFGSTLAKSQYPCTLQQARVAILTRRQCADSGLDPQYSHVPGTFCAGVLAGGVDSCDGDSGGPIMTIGKDGAYTVEGVETIVNKNKLYFFVELRSQGIVSFGEGCARKNLPGVYTTVSAYLDFIHSAVSSTEDLLGGDGEDSSSTFPPVDTEDPSPTFPEDTTPSTLPPSPSPSLLESLLSFLSPWVAPHPATASPCGGGDISAVNGSSDVATRPLSPLEYFLLQLFHRNQRQRRRPAYTRTLG